MEQQEQIQETMRKIINECTDIYLCEIADVSCHQAMVLFREGYSMEILNDVVVFWK